VIVDTSIGNCPRVWVGCLGCYNAGRLRGVWITAEEMLDELAANHVTFKGLGVPSDRGTLCALCGGEEWDVMDSEGVPRDCQNVRGFMDNADALVEMDADVLGRLIVLGGWLGGDGSSRSHALRASDKLLSLPSQLKSWLRSCRSMHVCKILP
jgi:hypothetical protein